MTTTDRALSDAVAAIVVDHDVPDALSQLVHACCLAYPSDSAAILVRNGAGELELLSSSTHKVDGIELLQIQSDRGPCAEVIDSDAPIIVSGAAALIERWTDVGQAIVNAGFDEAHSYPMRWRGQTIGGLNLFLRSGAASNPTVGQLCADLATLAVLQSNDMTADQLVSRIHEAVSSRAVIEQAKGVLAVREGIDMDQAFGRLREMSGRSGFGISMTAANVILDAYREPEPPRSPQSGA